MTRRARDARSLPPLAQEALRRKVVHAVRLGMTQMEAARRFGVSRVAVNGWVKRWRNGGLRALRPGRHGRLGPRLARDKVAMIARLTVERRPEQLRLPFALWTRAAVRQLLLQRCGLAFSMATVGRRVMQWNLAPPNPFRRARERGPLEVRRWLEQQYPEIRARAKLERAEIHWAGVMDLRPNPRAERSRGRRGREPVIPGSGQDLRRKAISTITSSGAQAFMVVREDVTAPVFIRFLKRLLRHRTGHKLFLILGDHPVHQAPEVQRWIAANPGRRLTPFYLPEVSA